MLGPITIEAVDRELVDYRTILANVSPAGRVAVWEQIDRLLELRRKLALKEKRAARLVKSA